MRHAYRAASRHRWRGCWRNAYVEELGAELDESSAVTVIDLLRDSPRDRVSPYEESDQRYHVRGGNDLVVQRMAESLGGRIETGTRLVALARRPDGRYRLTLARNEARRDIDADHVILAMPFTLLSDVDLANAGFRARKLRAIRELGMGRNTKLQLQFSDRALGRAARQRRDARRERLPGQLGSHARATGHARHPELLLGRRDGGEGRRRNAGGSRTRSARRARAACIPGIGARWNGRVIRNPWDRYPWSRGSYSLIRPGQYTAFHGIEHLPEGRVRFAGEQSSAEWYGYMNGAVESGLRAAREVLAHARPPRCLRSRSRLRFAAVARGARRSVTDGRGRSGTIADSLRFDAMASVKPPDPTSSATRTSTAAAYSPPARSRREPASSSTRASASAGPRR